jgi:hypothetical protein
MLLVRVSQLVIEQPLLKELDINPLLVSEKAVPILWWRWMLAWPCTPQGWSYRTGAQTGHSPLPHPVC